MNCRRVVNLMSAYVDGELTGEEMLAIRRHMGTCSECSEEREVLLLTKRAVSSLGTARPRNDFAAAIIAQLDEITVPKHQRFADWLLRVLREKVSPVAAALAVSGAALVIMSAGQVDKLAPVATADTMGASMQTVSFMKGFERDSSILASAQPLKLATDIPGVNEPRVCFTSLITE